MAVAAVIAVVIILLAWLFWPGGSAQDRRSARGERPGVDEDELAAAERDVLQAADEETVRDWGPGTGQKPLP
jgi:hypothetical protein